MAEGRKPLSELEVYDLIRETVNPMSEIHPQDKEDFINDCYVAIYSCFSVGGNQDLVTPAFVQRTIARLMSKYSEQSRIAKEMLSFERQTNRPARAASNGMSDAEQFLLSLNDTQRKMLAMKMENPKITLQAIADQCGCSRQFVFKVLKKVTEKYQEWTEGE